MRAPLERCGAIIARSRPVTAGDGHRQSSELVRWDQAHPVPGTSLTDPRQALAGLTAAAARAAVVAPERELRRWFSWPWYWTDGLLDGLLRLAGCAKPMATSPRQRDRPGQPSRPPAHTPVSESRAEPHAA